MFKLPYKNENCWGISVLKDGIWYPINSYNYPISVELKENAWEIELPEGEYLITAGIRNYNGDPYIKAKQIYLSNNKVTHLKWEISIPVKYWSKRDFIKRRNIKQEILISKINNLNRKLKIKDYFGKDNIMIIFASENEPSKRMIPLIDKVLEGFKGVIFQINTDLKTPLPEFKKISYINDYTKEALNSLIPKKRYNLPIVIIIDKNKNIALWQEGYNLNIDRILQTFYKFIK